MRQAAEEILQERHVDMFAKPLEDRLRKHQDGLGEDDRHDAGIIDAQRHERRAAGIHLAPDRALGVLHGNFPLRLGDGDDAGDHHRQQQNQQQCRVPMR